MPELPEVETTMRLIRPQLEGRTITGADVSWARTLGGLTRPAFERAVQGARIARLRRRAKHIVLELERDGLEAGALLVHLRMTGRLYVEPAAAPASPYVRVRLPLDDGTALHFLDVRKFGRVLFAREPESVLGTLGPEPLDDAFTADVFRNALRRRRRMLKPLLLDQTFVAGLGNIYVDEALFLARLHPLRRADTVRKAQGIALHSAIREVLAAAIEHQGSSFDTFYRTPEGQPGSYQHEFRVYGRTGKPCPRCGAPVRRLVVGQRGTHVCLRCQRPPRTR
ncbi:MAG: bifunctional DNA-formamidopyrimidine glycosylase/DNA-(apurinic or apyrimidinic site) lyase [Planctomycetota bacterium]|nr:bifunctional DNA-formamidopyrimidine glycosylase/DNA-(apurinic or apyrimidinic site) lyase [Planctomycetota bacterium]